MATLYRCLAILTLNIKYVTELIRPSFLAPAVASAEPADAAECAVCLSEIGEGGEVSKKLRCRHVFHRCCLDRWVEHRGRTCPVCRDQLLVHGKKREAEPKLGIWREATTLVFSPFSGFSQEDNWWLR